MEGMTEGLSHTPFIIASYAVAAVLLAWCAFAPALRRKTALKHIRRLITIEEESRDSNP